MPYFGFNPVVQNNGLLQGLGAGLSSAVDSYKDFSKMNQDREEKRRESQERLAGKGMEYDPESGTYELTDAEADKQAQANMLKEHAENFKYLQEVPKFIASGKDPQMLVNLYQGRTNAMRKKYGKSFDDYFGGASTDPTQGLIQAAAASGQNSDDQAVSPPPEGDFQSSPTKGLLGPGKLPPKSSGGLVSQPISNSDDSGQMTLKDIPGYVTPNQMQRAKFEATQAQRDQANQYKKQQAESASSAKQDRAFGSVQQLLESARGNPAAAQAERDIYAAQKADSLAKLYGDPNKLSPQMVQMLQAEVAKIASGNAPTMHELQGLNVNTMPKTLASVMQSFMNAPSPANAGAFVQQYQDYAHALTQDAQKVISDKYGRIIESNKKRIGDDNYSTLKDNYLNRFTQQVPEGSTPTKGKGLLSGAGSSTKAPKVGTVMDGFVFTGGDPAQKSSWKAQ